MSGIHKTCLKMWIGAVMLTTASAFAEPPEPPPTNGAQGTHLHGTDRFESINIPLASVEASAPPAGVTCAPARAQALGGRVAALQGCSGGSPPVTSRFLEGPSLVGTSFRAPFEGRAVKLVITDAQCHVPIKEPNKPDCTPQEILNGKAYWEYRVTASTDDGTTVPLCPLGSGFALPVPNAWSVGGALLPNPDYFTFACTPRNEGTDELPFFVGGGVIAKCIDWGYPPWAGAYPQNLAMKYHQLCTRMAMADYCGEGRSNTLDGTPLSFMGVQNAIAISANGRLPKTLGKDNGYSLEAVWKMSACGDVRPLCLGKTRWDSLPLEATCVNRALDLHERTQPCEDVDMNLLSGTTLLVSYSLFIDHALVSFKANGTNFVTTSAVTVDLKAHSWGPDVSAYGLDLDGNGVADVSPFVPMRMEGPLLSAKLPKEILKRMGKLIAPLYRCSDGLGHYLLTDDSACEPRQGYTLLVVNGDSGIEGYLYSAVDTTSTGQRRTLKLWHHPTLGLYATSTEAPDGYTFVRDLGYLPSVGQLPGRDL